MTPFWPMVAQLDDPTRVDETKHQCNLWWC
jgi:hypothetical protein